MVHLSYPDYNKEIQTWKPSSMCPNLYCLCNPLWAKERKTGARFISRLAAVEKKQQQQQSTAADT
jgi:hypothetical protein